MEEYLEIIDKIPNYGMKLFQYNQNRVDFLYKLHELKIWNLTNTSQIKLLQFLCENYYLFLSHPLPDLIIEYLENAPVIPSEIREWNNVLPQSSSSRQILDIWIHQIDSHNSTKSRLFSDTDSILIVASSNKKLRLSLDIFSDDESEEADEDDISTSVLPQEIPEKQSILISVEVQDRIASLFSKITLCEEQMKTDPSSILLIGVLCEIIDEALEMTQSCLPRNSASLFFLSICIHQLQLHSAKMISDEQFLRLVESYVDSNLRSIENILFFVIGVVLQRVRKLHSPSSRLLVKAIEICITQCSENFNFVLSRILTPPFKLEPSATSSSIDLVQENFDVNSFQYELVQRIIRQNSYFNSHNINSLLANLMTPSDVASWTLQMKFSEEYFLLDAFLNSTYTLPFQTEPIVQYISNFTENKLIPSCFPITQDSVKFLGSIFQSSIKNLHLSTLTTVVRYLEFSLNGVSSLNSFPTLGNILHSIITNHPQVIETCKEELISLLQRLNTVISQNLLKRLQN